MKKDCKSNEKYVAAPAAPAAVSAAPAAVPVPDLVALLGTKADGWAPKPFAGLKKNMTPKQAGKVLPWASKLTSGDAENTATGVTGVAKYRIHYSDNKLFQVEIWFDASQHTKAFHDAFVKAANAKWGDTKSDTSDMSRLVFWNSPTGQMASLGEYDGAFKLEMQLE